MGRCGRPDLSPEVSYIFGLNTLHHEGPCATDRSRAHPDAIDGLRRRRTERVLDISEATGRVARGGGIGQATESEV